MKHLERNKILGNNQQKQDLNMLLLAQIEEKKLEKLKIVNNLTKITIYLDI